MAEQIHIELIDDLDGSSPAAETVSFALDGVTYDIDLNEKHAQMLRSTLADYTQAGRATCSAATRGEEKQKHRTRQANKAHTHEIRQAADAVRHPRRPPRQPGKTLHTKPEPTIAAVLTAEAGPSRSHTASTNGTPTGTQVPVIAPVEFQQAT